MLDANWSADADGLSDVAFNYGHQGGRHDLAVGLVDTSLGRWTRQDPSGYVDGMNLTEAKASNPVIWTDQYGLTVVHGYPNDDIARAEVLEALRMLIDTRGLPAGGSLDEILDSAIDEYRAMRAAGDPSASEWTDVDARLRLVANMHRLGYSFTEEMVNLRMRDDLDWDYFVKCFDDTSSSRLFQILGLGGAGGAVGGALTTPYPKPTDAYPKGSGYTNLWHKLFRSNSLKRPFVKQIGVRAATLVGRIGTKAIPGVGWGLPLGAQSLPPNVPKNVQRKQGVDEPRSIGLGVPGLPRNS